MIDGRKLVLVMPAYNAEATLERTVADIPTLVDQVILVDDGSTDRTVELSLKLGLHTIVHDRNRGYGANQKTCYAEALTGVPTSWSGSPRLPIHAEAVPAPLALHLQRPLRCRTRLRILGGQALAGGMPLYKYVPTAP